MKKKKVILVNCVQGNFSDNVFRLKFKFINFKATGKHRMLFGKEAERPLSCYEIFY